MKKRILFILCSIFTILLFPCNKVQAEEITFGFNTGELVGGQDNNHSDTVGTTTLVIESSDITDIVSNAYQAASDFSYTGEFASGYVIAMSDYEYYAPNGTITVRLSDNKLFTLKQFSYIKFNSYDETISITTNKGSETFIVSDLCTVITPSNTYDFSVIDSFTISFGSNGESCVFDNFVIQTLDAVEITTSPSDTLVNQGLNTSLTVSSTGDAKSYQWQVDTGSGFTDISDGGVYSGATTATLSLAEATASMNGYKYRVIVDGYVDITPGITSVISAEAILTVNTPPSISDQPDDVTVNASSNTSFTVAATTTNGAALTYQWQINTGSSFTNITDGGVYSGATTATLNITGVTGSMNGYRYRVIVTGAGSLSTTSTEAVLTVNIPASITVQPSNETINQGNNTSLTVTAVGTDLTYQWQVDEGSGFTNLTNSGVYSGATTATLQITGASGTMNDYQFRVVVTGTAAIAGNAVTSDAAVLTVNTPPTITTPPGNTIVTAGANTSLTVTATTTNGAALTYQWQISTGGSFTNITDGGVYSGANTATLNITGATASMNGYRYRVIITGAGALSIISSEAVLTVNIPASITTQPDNADIRQGSNITFTIAAAGTNLTYQWQVDTGSGFTNLTNGEVYSGATTETLQITGAAWSMNGYRYRVLVNGAALVEVISNEVLLTVIRTYRIIYYGNGSSNGTTPYDTDDYLPGETAIIKSNSGNLVRSGYSFECWNTRSDGSGTDYMADDDLTMGSEDIPVYAKWKALPPVNPPQVQNQEDKQNKLPKLEDDNQTSGWNNIVSELTESKNNSYTIDMNGSDSIPVTVLETIKGKDIDVIINLGNGIEWVINGKDVNKLDASVSEPNPDNPDNVPAINLNVTLNTDSIPEDVISGMSGNKTIQMSLDYEGDFGFTAKLRLNINEENRGMIANLFYYNPVTNKLEFQAVSRVNNQGNILLNFTHASDYVIVLDNKVLLEDTMPQVTIKTLKKTLYIGGNKDSNVKIGVNIPDSIVQAIKDGLAIQKITYQSSNPEVAIVTGSGIVKAKAVGKTTITTTIFINGIEKSFTTKITVKKAYIKLVNTTNTIEKGKSFTFTAIGYGVDTQKIIWKTTQKSILVIESKTGKASAKSSGTDYVVAKSGSITIKVKVVVTNPKS